MLLSFSHASIILVVLSFLLGSAKSFGLETVLPTIHDNLQTNLQNIINQSASSSPSFLTQHAIAMKTISNNFPPSSSVVTANINSDSGSIVITEVVSYFLKDYRNALEANPLRIKIITGCLLAIVGDAIAQKSAAEKDSYYNKKRAVAFVIFDGVWRTVQQVTYGPMYQICNGKLSSSIIASLPFASKIQDQLNRVVLGAIEQTLVSQLVFIPLLYYPIFYFVTGIVQNLTIEETIKRAKETFIPLMKRNLSFWIPVQFCAFYFIEENLQIPVLTASGLIWTIILSLYAGNVNKSSIEDEKESNNSKTMDGSYYAVEEKMILESTAGGLPTGSSLFINDGSKINNNNTTLSSYDEKKNKVEVNNTTKTESTEVENTITR